MIASKWSEPHVGRISPERAQATRPPSAARLGSAGGRAGRARPTMSDGEDYGFEYSDDDQEEEDVNIENQYYNSKGLLADSDLQGALDGFKEVVTMEDEKGEWGFKAHKQMVRAVHPPRTLPRAAPLGPLRACTEPAASPQQAATCCAAAGEAAVQAEELQGDDGHVQGHAHVHQVRSRASLSPRSPLALHPSRALPAQLPRI